MKAISRNKIARLAKCCTAVAKLSMSSNKFDSCASAQSAEDGPLPTVLRPMDCGLSSAAFKTAAEHSTVTTSSNLLASPSCTGITNVLNIKLLQRNGGTVQQCNRGTERNRGTEGTEERWNSGTADQRIQRNSGTEEQRIQWNSGTEEQWNRGTVEQRNSGTEEQRNSGTEEQWNSGTEEQWNRGREDTEEQWNSGTEEQ